MARSAVVVGVGASQGLGAALCRRFAREGLHVAVGGRTREKVDFPDPAAAPLGTDDEAAALAWLYARQAAIGVNFAQQRCTTGYEQHSVRAGALLDQRTRDGGRGFRKAIANPHVPAQRLEALLDVARQVCAARYEETQLSGDRPSHRRQKVRAKAPMGDLP